jgi:hypothetical protein
MAGFLRRLKYWWRAGRMEAELAEEFELHRQLRQSELEASGMAPAEAAATSRRALGNVALQRWPALRCCW